MRLVQRLLFLLGLVPVCLSQAASETINVYSYHNHPPFVTSPGRGLTHDLVKLLNHQAQGRFRFQLRIVPRRRLNALLNPWISGRCPSKTELCRTQWLVPWVNPQWGFGPDPQRRYDWRAILEDANSIISLRAQPVDYEGPESLDGLRFGGIGGHRYVGIDERVAQGKIQRIDGNLERNNLIKLMQGRLDAILLPRSTIGYLLHRDPALDQHRARFYIAPTPHQSYTRYLMIPQGHQALARFIHQLRLDGDHWRAALKAVGLSASP